jgi:hypothetical protein
VLSVLAHRYLFALFGQDLMQLLTRLKIQIDESLANQAWQYSKIYSHKASSLRLLTPHSIGRVLANLLRVNLKDWIMGSLRPCQRCCLRRAWLEAWLGIEVILTFFVSKSGTCVNRYYGTVLSQLIVMSTQSMTLVRHLSVVLLFKSKYSVRYPGSVKLCAPCDCCEFYL